MARNPVSEWETSVEKPQRCTLKILTPVHIGDGEEISPIQYVKDNGELILVDVEAMFKDQNFNPQSFSQYVKNNKSPYLGGFDEKLARKYPRKRLKLETSLGPHYPSIKKHVRTGGNLYIPGSSLKGAINSALLYYGIKKQIENKSELREAVEACLLKDNRKLKGMRFSKEDYQKYGKGDFKKVLYRIGLDYFLRDEVQGKEKGGLDFKALAEVSDAHQQDLTSAIYGSKVMGTRRKLPAYYEALTPDNELLFTIKSLGFRLSLKNLFQIVNNFYAQVLKRDKQWLEENNMKYLVNDVLKLIKNTEGRLIRIGQGSGSLSMSFPILAEEMGLADYAKNWGVTGHNTQDPKTRKFLQDIRKKSLPMGWAKIGI